MFFNNQWNPISELDVIGEMQRFANANPGDPRDIDAMIKYLKSWEGVAPYNGNRKTPFVHDDWRASGMFNDHAPAESRWDYLFRGMQDFVEVLESTPAEEKISLVVFNDGAEARSSLTLNYQAVLDQVEGIIPDNGTAIHLGLGQGLAKVLEEDNSRPFTEKFIVVMTDGENNNINGVPGSGDAAVLQAANDVLVDAEAAGKEVTIHTLTFGDGSGISANPDFPHASAQPWEGVMVDVAAISGGEHFHAEEAEELQLKLREIANIQPTIFTF